MVVVENSLYYYTNKVMTINELVIRCKDIVLDKLQFASFNLGNTWDQATQKGDTYPTAWVELPIAVEYTSVGSHSKQYTFSIVFLNMPKIDNVPDEVNMISHMEQYADIFLQYLKQDKDMALVERGIGVSVKTLNADYACGIRLDIRVNTGRECDLICPIEYC